MLSKRDLLPADEVEEATGRVAAAPRRGRPRRARGLLGDRRGPRRAAPAAILAELPEDVAGAPRATRRPPAEFEVEHRVYRPVGEGGYSVEREDDGGFRVLGRGVELLFERHDLKNEEALAYLEQRLNEIGVIAALTAPASSPATTSASASTSSSCTSSAGAEAPAHEGGGVLRVSAGALRDGAQTRNRDFVEIDGDDPPSIAAWGVVGHRRHDAGTAVAAANEG